MRIWSVDGGRPVTTIENRGDAIYGVDLSPDDQQVATVGVNGIVALYDADGGDRRILLRGDSGNYGNSVQFSPNGSRLVVPMVDGTVRVIPADGRGRVTVLRGHSDLVYAARFNRDGSRVVSAAADRTARIWDIAAGTRSCCRTRAPYRASLSRAMAGSPRLQRTGSSASGPRAAVAAR